MGMPPTHSPETMLAPPGARSARSGEAIAYGRILALNVEALDLDNCRAPIRSKGGETEWVYWGTGTAHLLPRLLHLPDGSSRTSGPVFLSSRRRCARPTPWPGRHLSAHRAGAARLRPCSHPAPGINGMEPPPAPPLSGDPPRRQGCPVAADHGEDQAQVAPHGDALRQPWPSGRRRGDRAAQPAQTDRLTDSVRHREGLVDRSDPGRELVAKKGLGLRQTTVLDAAWFDRFG